MLTARGEIRDKHSNRKRWSRQRSKADEKRERGRGIESRDLNPTADDRWQINIANGLNTADAMRIVVLYALWRVAVDQPNKATKAYPFHSYASWEGTSRQLQ